MQKNLNRSPLLKVSELTKNFEIAGKLFPVLKNINLSINAGEMAALVGSSGSGKSTLMNILGCLDSPTSGHYELCGAEVATMNSNQLASMRAKTIGFVFQKFNLIASLSAKENIVLPQLYNNMPRQEAELRAQDLLHLVGLGGWQAHMPFQMSGGQLQRVAIARALANSPKIILADEPTGSLDSKSGNMILDLFKTLQAELGLTILLVTHDMQIAQAADQIFTMQDGQLQS